MIFRESTQADLDFMADHSIKGGMKQFKFIDYVYTLEHDDIPLGIGGFRMIVPTTAWCWVDLSDKALEHLRDSYRTIKEWIETFANTHQIIRLQAFVRDTPEDRRLVRHLGFIEESRMEKFYGDEDALLYVRIF